MLNINPNPLPESSVHHVEPADLRKRAKHLQKCKEGMWNHRTKEYIRSLQEQHRRAGGEQTSQPKVGDVVNVKPEKKNRKGWNHMSGQVNSWKQ